MEGAGNRTFFVCIRSPVEKNTTTSYTVVRPEVLRAFVIGFRALDISAMGIVIESLTGDMCELGNVSLRQGALVRQLQWR